MARSTRPGVVRRFLRGVTYLGRGFAVWGRSPRLMLLGAIPALIVGAVYVAAIVLLAINLDTVVTWMTPFASRWALVEAFRVIVGVALVGVAVLLAAVTFAAVTLAVGDPFYERIWRAVEQRLGDAPGEPEEPFWRGARRGIANGFRLLLLAASLGILLFVCGFLPVVGQSVAPVVGAFVGGWLLALELTGFAFDGRGLRLKDRRRMLGARRPESLGFGLATYLLFLVPLAAIVVMPAAVAGATLLARDALRGGAPSP